MYLIKFSKQTEKDKPRLKAAGLETKAKSLLNLMQDNPFQNPPPYEKLVGNLSGNLSRRINIQHRLVYACWKTSRAMLRRQESSTTASFSSNGCGCITNRQRRNRHADSIRSRTLPRTADDVAAGISGQEHIRRMLDKSLANLDMDYVDLYIYHMWDYNTPMEELMAGLNTAVQSGKTRYIGIANAYAWQIAEANALAREHGWAEFISVQNHYNLIYREDERELMAYCAERGIAATPYSALASGRLARRPGETSARLAADSYARFKYDAAAEMDAPVIARVMELADRHDVPMSVISLAWLLTKVTSPIVGATKLHHIDAPVAAVDFTLTDEEIAYLEEPYRPHPLSGVMAQNSPATHGEKKVWSVGNQKI